MLKIVMDVIYLLEKMIKYLMLFLMILVKPCIKIIIY